ncbi:MAG: HEPN domain-containing protein [Ignisphaera sp.]
MGDCTMFAEYDVEVGDEESHEHLVDLYRRRSRNALTRAMRDLEAGDYDGAVFDAEQAVQLYLKSIILEYTDATPRTHNLRKLLQVVGELLGASNEFKEFIKANKYKLHTLEDAYYSSRYLPKEFSKEDAEELVKFAEEVIKFVESRKASKASH